MWLIFVKLIKESKQILHLWADTSEIVSDWICNETTSSDEFPAFIHQVRGQVIVSDVLMKAEEVQTARAQATNPDTQLQCAA